MNQERRHDRFAAKRDALHYDLARMVDHVVRDRDGKIPIRLAFSHPGRAILREEARSRCKLRCAHEELDAVQERPFAAANNVMAMDVILQVAAKPSRARRPIPVDRIRVFAATPVRVVQNRTPSIASPRFPCTVPLEVKAVGALRTFFVGVAARLR